MSCCSPQKSRQVIFSLVLSFRGVSGSVFGTYYTHYTQREPYYFTKVCPLDRVESAIPPSLQHSLFDFEVVSCWYEGYEVR
jgi:hypothetical protein